MQILKMLPMLSGTELKRRVDDVGLLGPVQFGNADCGTGCGIASAVVNLKKIYFFFNPDTYLSAMTYFFSEKIFKTALDESPGAHVPRLLLTPHERYQQM